jgi:hypothetical protein
MVLSNVNYGIPQVRSVKLSQLLESIIFNNKEVTLSNGGGASKTYGSDGDVDPVTK